MSALRRHAEAILIHLLLDSFLILFCPFFFTYPVCEIIFLDPLTKMTVYSCHKTGISLVDIKLKSSLSLSLSLNFLSPLFSRCHAMYRRDRFLAYNILSLVANREETKARA